jgi:hypothetical protein
MSDVYDNVKREIDRRRRTRECEKGHHTIELHIKAPEMGHQAVEQPGNNGM